jgi:[acyl-carrier-protein] S-malonyltransferase
MASEKLSALVVCPGRGTYNKAELGYLHRHHERRLDLLAGIDRLRSARGEPTVTELDGAERFSVATYSRGDIASPLIFASAYADSLAIDRDRYRIAAITGNSMGWYTALACAGAVGEEAGFAIIDAMGEHSQRGLPGGQILLQLVDEDWRPVPGLREQVLALVAEIGARPGYALFVSIELGGMVVLAGNEEGLAALLAEAPPIPGREPMRLANHGPFHTPLMQESSDRATASLSPDWFHSPAVPMVDGRGHIWRPFASPAEALWRYTFTTQILETYDFTRALHVAVKEFAPDRIILLGPGDTLGGAIAQSLIAIGWQGLASKADFQDRQARDPLLLAMGRDGQRETVTGE